MVSKLPVFGEIYTIWLIKDGVRENTSSTGDVDIHTSIYPLVN